jgi:hypothetical protein
MGYLYTFDLLGGWLTLELPNGIDPIWVCEQLSELTGSIVNMSVNQVGHPDEPNDEFYSLKQSNLHQVPWLLSNETYDINIQPAWDVKTGYNLSDDWKPLVGVYDSGVLFTHTDLQSFLGQTVTGGADFITGGSTTVFDTGDPSVNGHGTAELEGNCQFQVFDTQGNMVWENTVKAMHAGVYRERINLPNAAHGLYFVSVKTPTQYHSSRIFKR